VSDFLAALGLVLVLEGLLYAAFGPQMRKGLAAFMALPVSTIRAVGLGAAAAGLLLLWAIRG